MNNPKLTFGLNGDGIDKFEMSLPLDHFTAPKFAELETYVKVWRSMEGYPADYSRPEFAGFVGPITEGGGNVVNIVAWSPFYMLQARYLFDLLKFGYPLKTGTAVDQGEILWSLIDYTNQRADTNIARGDIAPTTPRKRKYDKGQNIWQAIANMTTVLGGVDITPTYVHTDNDPTLCLFNVSFARGEYNPDARIDYWTGVKNCTDMTRQSNVDIGQVVTLAQEVGQGAPFAISEDFDEIDNGIGLWEEFQSQPNAQSFDLLKAYADDEITEKSQVRRTIQASISPVLRPWFGRDYALGDVVPVAANRGRMKFADYLRIYGVELSLDDNGMESTTLTLARDADGVVPNVPPSTDLVFPGG